MLEEGLRPRTSPLVTPCAVELSIMICIAIGDVFELISNRELDPKAFPQQIPRMIPYCSEGWKSHVQTSYKHARNLNLHDTHLRDEDRAAQSAKMTSTYTKLEALKEQHSK
jgi:hypothetical protein